jgi:IS1 family transposase
VTEPVEATASDPVEATASAAAREPAVVSDEGTALAGVSDAATEPAAGERWGCLSQDRPSRFVIAWRGGARTVELAVAVVAQTRARTAKQAGVRWVSDGWAAYVAAVDQTYRDASPSTINPKWAILRLAPGTSLTQAVKHRQGRRLKGITVVTPIGEAVEQPHTVHVERLNGVLRDRLACLTRKTHAFARRAATWDACVSVALFEHNFLRPHHALRRALPEPVDGRRYERRTPAMALGITDHPWSWAEFLSTPRCPHP